MFSLPGTYTTEQPEYKRQITDSFFEIVQKQGL